MNKKRNLTRRSSNGQKGFSDRSFRWDSHPGCSRRRLFLEKDFHKKEETQALISLDSLHLAREAAFFDVEEREEGQQQGYRSKRSPGKWNKSVALRCAAEKFPAPYRRSLPFLFSRLRVFA